MKSLLVGFMMAYYGGSHDCDKKELISHYRKFYIPASSITKLDEGRIECKGEKAYNYCIVRTNTKDDYITATKCDVVAEKLNRGLE